MRAGLQFKDSGLEELAASRCYCQMPQQRASLLLDDAQYGMAG
jgi:hypothetical protein